MLDIVTVGTAAVACAGRDRRNRLQSRTPPHCRAPGHSHRYTGDHKVSICSYTSIPAWPCWRGLKLPIIITLYTLVLAARDYDVEEPSPVRFEKYGREPSDIYDEDADGNSLITCVDEVFFHSSNICAYVLQRSFPKFLYHYKTWRQRYKTWRATI